MAYARNWVIPAMRTGITDNRFMRNAGIPMYGVSGIFSAPGDGPGPRLIHP